MADTDDLATEAVRLAIQAAGPIGGNAAGWLHRIQESVPVIAAILRPPMQGRENDPSIMSVTARKVLESAVFKAEYVDHSLEESSQRIVARFKSETTNQNERESDGTEHIRTEPMWSAAGRLMRSKLDQLVPGQDVFVYKHMEQIDAQRKVRVLVHLVALGKRPEQGTRPAVEPPPLQGTAAPATRSAAAGDPAPSAAARPQSTEVPVDDTPHGAFYAQVQEKLEALTGRQRVAWAALCRGKGVTSFNDPESEQDFNKVIQAFNELSKMGKADGQSTTES